MSEPVRLEREGAIAVVTLARPQTRNALDDAMSAALVATSEAINADLSIGCVVITGEGPGFCAGGNVKDMVAGRGMFGGLALASVARPAESGVKTPALTGAPLVINQS